MYKDIKIISFAEQRECLSALKKDSPRKCWRGWGAGNKIISRKAMIRIALSNTIDDGLLIYLKQ